MSHRNQPSPPNKYQANGQQAHDPKRATQRPQPKENKYKWVVQLLGLIVALLLIYALLVTCAFPPDETLISHDPENTGPSTEVRTLTTQYLGTDPSLTF